MQRLLAISAAVGGQEYLFAEDRNILNDTLIAIICQCNGIGLSLAIALIEQACISLLGQAFVLLSASVLAKHPYEF